MRTIAFMMCLWMILAPTGLAAHEELLSEEQAAAAGIGIDDKTGQIIPPDITLFDENGAEVRLGDLTGKPVILNLVYYTCDRICPQMLAGLAQVLPQLSLVPGKQFRILTVSFDETDTPEIARSKKNNYMMAIDRPFPENAWRFLTGRKAGIDRLTEATGFQYRRDSHGFIHPVVLVMLSPEGKIVKYMQVTKYEYGQAYPITFAPFDLDVALTEAAQGRAVTGVQKAVLYCFAHEPKGLGKFFGILSIVGVITLVIMVAFFLYLKVTEKRYRRSE
ncbi:MAG TPA: SCO family protein [Syntrophales bacterium]|nr:SCO family protein [Syntrophales bacterium]